MTGDLETHPLVSMKSSETVSEAARLMSDCGMSAIGVLDDDRRFAGILTERDITWLVAQGKVASETLLSDVANDFPVVVEAPISEQEARERMARAHIRHLIVKDRDDYRIVSMRDLVLPHTLVEAGDTTAGPQRSRGRLTAKDVMTAPGVACREEAFFEEVAEILADRDISGMPVVNDVGEVVGVISERDLAHVLGGPLVRLAVRRHSHGPFMRKLTEVPRAARRARDVMTTPPIVARFDTPIQEIARVMVVEEINRLPVVEDGRLVGVVTRGDVLGAIAGLDHAAIDLTRVATVVGTGGFTLERPSPFAGMVGSSSDK